MEIAELDRQLPLFEDRPAPRIDLSREDRLYFALRPTLEASRQMSAVAAALIEEHGLSGRPRPVDTFHVSVLGVGFYRQLSREEVAIAEAAATAIAFEPFRLTFAHVMSYPRPDGRNALVLIAEEKEQVNRLAGVLAAAMVRRGFRPRGTLRGEAHLTLLYDRFVKPRAELDRAIAFDVTGFFLVRSHHGQSRHENQRFPFQS